MIIRPYTKLTGKQSGQISDWLNSLSIAKAEAFVPFELKDSSKIYTIYVNQSKLLLAKLLILADYSLK